MYDNLPDLLTSEEACEFLRVTPLSLYSYIKGGKLKAYRVGKRYRISKAALIEFLEGQVSDDAPVTPITAPQAALGASQDAVAEKISEIFGKK